MKAADIVTQLRAVIPRYTNLFSNTISVSSLSYSAGLVTCVTAMPHGLTTGDTCYIAGALTPITITTLTQVDNVATAITASNHDFTDGYTQTVDIAGADQLEYNGVHKFIHQANRRTFTFQISGNPVSPATGTHIYTLQPIKHVYNGYQTVTVIDPYVVTYPITSAPESPAQGTITLQSQIRISGAVSVERSVQAYTKQAQNQLWMFVALGNATASKDRFTQSDAVSTRLSGQDYRQRVVNPFSIYVYAPCSSDLSAMDTRDTMEDVLEFILHAIDLYKFTSPFSDQTDFGAIFTGHNIYAYEMAYYVHEFKFEMTYDLTKEDTLDDDDSVAFRDLNFGFLNDYGVDTMQTNTNLDDVPLT
jgi:hypothetical protein